jgi:hypothetical protein
VRAGLALALLAAGWAGGGCAAPRVIAPASYRVIAIENGASELFSVRTALDSPVLSNDGRRLAVQAEEYRDPALPYEVYSLIVAESRGGQWTPIEARGGRYRRWLGRMEMPIQPAFDETGEQIYLTYIRFDSVLSIPCFPTLRSWIEVIPWPGGPPLKVVTHRDWRFAATELIQHPRVSPDGQWLTFYTRVERARQGVYLLHLATRARYRLSDQHDKHPTWSPDGRRIWFHHSFGGKRHRFDFFGGGVERSVLGYLELRFDGPRLIESRRVLLDGLDQPAFIYHKHPAPLPGSDLVFFHGRSSPEGKMHLMVRRAEPGSEVFIVKPTVGGQVLKAAKHPAAPLAARALVFIAKSKGKDAYDRLLGLTEAALNELEAQVGRSPAASAPAATAPPRAE